MADMHKIELTGSAHTLPARGKRPAINHLNIAWSRISNWPEPPPEPVPPHTTPVVIGASRSLAARSHGNHLQERPMVTHAHSRVLHKIASHRQKSGYIAGGAPTPASFRGMIPRPQHRTHAAPGKRVLTPREMEVLRLVAHGETDRKIAERLYLSRRTVSCHVSNILEKLDVESRRKAVLTAARIGLL